MKTICKTLIALVALVVFASCSKKSDDVVPTPATPPAAELAGAYNVTTFSYNGSPQTIESGHVITVKFGYMSDNKVVVLVNDSNDPTIDEDYGSMDVTWVNRSIEFRTGTAKMGTYENGMLELNLKEDDDTIHLTAKRK